MLVYEIDLGDDVIITLTWDPAAPYLTGSETFISQMRDEWKWNQNNGIRGFSFANGCDVPWTEIEKHGLALDSYLWDVYGKDAKLIAGEIPAFEIDDVFSVQ